MPQFRVTLARSFVVTVDAHDSGAAQRLAETFTGYHDESTTDYRERLRFSLRDIEMVMNEAIEAQEIEEVY